MNEVKLFGRLGKDIEIKDFNGNKKGVFPLATSYSYVNKSGEKIEVTDWHNIEVWGAKAEILKKYVSKGDQFLMDGELKTDKYEKDGETKYKTYVKLTRFWFVSGNKKEDDAEPPF